MGKDQELLDAARNGYYSIVEKILVNRARRSGPLASLRRSHGANAQDSSGYTALHHAALNGHKDIVALLMAHEASVNLPDSHGVTPLHLAAWTGNVDVVRTLITHGPSLVNVDCTNREQETPLHFACQYGHTAVVRLLLEHSCDSSVRSCRGDTPLLLAARYGRLPVVQLLVRVRPALLDPCRPAAAGGTLQLVDSSPLHAAASNGHVSVVELLLESGVDVNVCTDSGSALFVAALLGKLQTVQCLLDAGIDLTLQDSQGRDVMSVMSEISTPVSQQIRQMMQDRDRLVDTAVVANTGCTAPSLPAAVAVGCPYENVLMPRLSHAVPTERSCDIPPSRGQQEPSLPLPIGAAQTYDVPNRPLIGSDAGQLGDVIGRRSGLSTDLIGRRARSVDDVIDDVSAGDSYSSTRRLHVRQLAQLIEPVISRNAGDRASIAVPTADCHAASDRRIFQLLRSKSCEPDAAALSLTAPAALHDGRHDKRQLAVRPAGGSVGRVVGRRLGEVFTQEFSSLPRVGRNSRSGDSREMLNKPTPPVKPPRRSTDTVTSSAATGQQLLEHGDDVYELLADASSGSCGGYENVAELWRLREQLSSCDDSALLSVRRPRVKDRRRNRTTACDTAPVRLTAAETDPSPADADSASTGRYENYTPRFSLPQSTREGVDEAPVPTPDIYTNVVLRPKRSQLVNSAGSEAYENYTPPGRYVRATVPGCGLRASLDSKKRRAPVIPSTVATIAAKPKPVPPPRNTFIVKLSPSSPGSYSQPPTPDHPPPSANQAALCISQRVCPVTTQTVGTANCVGTRVSRDMETETDESLLQHPASGRVPSPGGESLLESDTSTDNIDRLKCGTLEGLYRGSVGYQLSISMPAPTDPAAAGDAICNMSADPPAGSLPPPTDPPTGSPPPPADPPPPPPRPFDEQREWNEVYDIMASYDDAFMGEIDDQLQRRNRKSASSSGSCAQLLFLWQLQLSHCHQLLVSAGYDDPDFLSGVLRGDDELLELGVRDAGQRLRLLQHVAEKLPRRIDECRRQTAALERVADWLLLIRLPQYTDTFHRHLYTDMDRVRGIWEMELVTVLEITRPGHLRRILLSLREPQQLQQPPHQVDTRQQLGQLSTSLALLHTEMNQLPTVVSSDPVNGAGDEETIPAPSQFSNGHHGGRASPTHVTELRVQLVGHVTTPLGQSTPRVLLESTNQRRSPPAPTPPTPQAPPPPPPKPRRRKSRSLSGATDDSGADSSGTAQGSISCRADVHQLQLREPTQLVLGVPSVLTTGWRHQSSKLINSAIQYSAEYLGSARIKEVRGTESTRQSIQKLKRNCLASGHTPRVLLSISHGGVRYLSCQTHKLICEHEIRNIQCACQDADDLSHFAYITMDEQTGCHYCHVFRVHSMDEAFEVILTLGQAFEVAYQLVLNDTPPTSARHTPASAQLTETRKMSLATTLTSPATTLTSPATTLTSSAAVID